MPRQTDDNGKRPHNAPNDQDHAQRKSHAFLRNYRHHMPHSPTTKSQSKHDSYPAGTSNYNDPTHFPSTPAYFPAPSLLTLFYQNAKVHASPNYFHQSHTNHTHHTTHTTTADSDNATSSPH